MSKILKKRGEGYWEESKEKIGTHKKGLYASSTKFTRSSGNEKSLMSGIDISDLHYISASDKISIIKEGVSKNDLIEIKAESGLDYETLSKILSISRATLHNKKARQKFDQATSERILLLADIVGYGQSVFEDKDRFNKWLKKPNKALGEKTPVELMETIHDIQEVKKEIGRIEYGVF